MNMGNVVEFLARVGQNAALRHASGEQLAAELEAAGIAPELSAAIHAGNAGGLRLLLGQGVFFASLMPDGPDKDNEEEDDRQDDDEDEEGEEKLSLSSESYMRR
jgi:hypothetical protein